MACCLLHHDFQPGPRLDALQDPELSAGAVVSFVGRVRGHEPGQTIDGLYLEHYPGMTETALQALETEARTRWPLLAVDIAHRVGWVGAGQTIVFVGVASPHRQAAFEAASYLMDQLKTRVPFWKRERRQGVDHWLDARDSDLDQAARWQTTAPDAGTETA